MINKHDSQVFQTVYIKVVTFDVFNRFGISYIPVVPFDNDIYMTNVCVCVGGSSDQRSEMNVVIMKW